MTTSKDYTQLCVWEGTTVGEEKVKDLVPIGNRIIIASNGGLYEVVNRKLRAIQEDWYIERILTTTDPSLMYVVTDETDARFMLIVGSKDFINLNDNQLPKPPLQTALRPSYPNPFKSSTIIRYDLNRAGETNLAIYDPRGSLVRVLHEGYLEPGRYETAWDGKNASGQAAATGVYFMRLKTKDRMLSEKTLLLR